MFLCQGTSKAQQTPPSVHNLDAQVHLGRKNALRVPTEGPTAWGRQNVPVGGCTGTVRAGEQLSKPQGLLLVAKRQLQWEPLPTLSDTEGNTAPEALLESQEVGWIL